MLFATIVEIEMDAAIDITQTNSTAMAKNSKFKPPVSVRKAIALVWSKHVSTCCEFEGMMHTCYVGTCN